MTNKNRPKPTVISTDPSKNIGMAIDDVNKGVSIDIPDAIIVDVQQDAHPVGTIEEIVNKNDYVDNNFIDDFMAIYTRWSYSKYSVDSVPEIMQKFYIDILRDADLKYLKDNILAYVEMVRKQS